MDDDKRIVPPTVWNLNNYIHAYDIPMVDLRKVNPESRMDVVENAIGALEGPKSMRRDRPYSGQSHTSQGERGRLEVKGLTVRDLRDCYVRAFILSHSVYQEGSLEPLEPNHTLYHEAMKGVDAQLNANDMHDVVGSFDPIAVSQNMAVEIEKLMGVFPNIRIVEDPTVLLDPPPAD